MKRELKHAFYLLIGPVMAIAFWIAVWWFAILYGTRHWAK